MVIIMLKVKYIGSVGDLKNNEILANAVILFNPSNVTINNVGLGFNEIGMDCNNDCNVRDLWLHKELGQMNNYSANIDSHSIVMLRISQ